VGAGSEILDCGGAGDGAVAEFEDGGVARPGDEAVDEFCDGGDVFRCVHQWGGEEFGGAGGGYAEAANGRGAVSEVYFHAEDAGGGRVACSLEVTGSCCGIEAGEENETLSALYQGTGSLGEEVNVGLCWGGELWAEHRGGVG